MHADYPFEKRRVFYRSFALSLLLFLNMIFHNFDTNLTAITFTTYQLFTIQDLLE